MSNQFFQEPEPQSLVKAEIVAAYFVAWARIMVKRSRSGRIGYFDFYAGPGRYGTGEKSTPLLIVERAIAEPNIGQRLVTIFNDSDETNTNSLRSELEQLPGFESLRYKPQISTDEVDDAVAERFEAIKTIPALSFIDPWGYKGLSLRLIRSVIKDWGCEAVFFFNYNRINMGVANPLVDAHMQALFGSERLPLLQQELDAAASHEREAILRRALGEALREMGAEYLIPFRFSRESGRASHYICFVSKHQLGYEIMKKIMATKGIVDEDNVPKFEYLPPHAGRQLPFTADRPLLALPEALLGVFAGRSLTVDEVFHEHNVGTPFIEKNYKDVLLRLEEAGRVEAKPQPGKRRRAGLMGDDVIITFPPLTPTG